MQSIARLRRSSSRAESSLEQHQVFISYRRATEGSLALLLHDRLAAAGFRVFLDHKSLGGGVRFADEICRAVESSAVVLVLIGRNWLDPGRPAADDFVVLEIERALESGRTLIPVLVDSAAMPRPEQLPERIRDIAGIQARAVNVDGADAQIDRVLDDIRRAIPGPIGGRTGVWWRRKPAVAAALVAVLVAGGVAAVVSWSPGGGHVESTNQEPMPASTSSPPLLVRSINDIVTDTRTGSFVLPDPVQLSPAELDAFNRDVAPKSPDMSSWYGERGGAAIGSGILEIALEGNESEPVQITDVRVVSHCGPPMDGTLFQGFTQGSGETVRMAFDMDTPNPVPQEMVVTAARGLHPTGTSFFALTTLTVAQHERMTLAIGAFTKKQSCAFSVRLVVSTADSLIYQDVDYHGKPFVVTAAAAPTTPGLPFSGYRAAYMRDYQAYLTGANTWVAADPRTYTE